MATQTGTATNTNNDELLRRSMDQAQSAATGSQNSNGDNQTRMINNAMNSVSQGSNAASKSNGSVGTSRQNQKNTGVSSGSSAGVPSSSGTSLEGVSQRTYNAAATPAASQTGSSGSNQQLSNYDRQYVTSGADRDSILQAKNAWSSATTEAARQAANDQAERVRAKYGYLGGNDGSQYIKLNDADMQYLSNDDKYNMLRYKQAYEQAAARGDQAGMQAAHEQAERLRLKYGYYGGADGSSVNRLSDADMQYLSDDDKYQMVQLKRQWEQANAKGDQAGMKAAHDAAENLRTKYGYWSGGSEGSGFRLVEEPNEATAPPDQNYQIVYNTMTGDAVRLIDPNTGEQSTYSGVVTDPNTKQQYIAKTDGSMVKLVSTPVQITDETGKEVTLRDANGNVLTPDMLAFGADNKTYLVTTGQDLGEVASQYGITSANTRFRVGDNYWSVLGVNMNDSMGPLGVQQWTDDDIYNKLYSELSEYGIGRTPYINDYDSLSWEQALAQATDQMNARYDLALQNTMDKLNRSALTSGFYGQLPTEALKAQAAASTELERQTAINDLARELMSDSRNYAQSLYEDDAKSVQQQMDTIVQLYNYLYKLNQDAINNAEDQTRLGQSQQQLDITKEQNEAQNEIQRQQIGLSNQELLLKAAQIADQLRAEGFDAPRIAEWLSRQG